MWLVGNHPLEVPFPHLHNARTSPNLWGHFLRSTGEKVLKRSTSRHGTEGSISQEKKIKLAFLQVSIQKKKTKDLTRYNGARQRKALKVRQRNLN